MAVNNDFLHQQFIRKYDTILDWFSRQDYNTSLPLYSSVDIRDAGFKAAVVDTNLFPAGFNNLCLKTIDKGARLFKQAILNRCPEANHIGLIAESHTRNQFYLRHIAQLSSFIEAAGFKVTVLSFMKDLHQDGMYCQLDTDQQLHVLPFNTLNPQDKPDFLLLNNDLSEGVPAALIDCNIPTYPSYKAGWHSRLKSEHFLHMQSCVQTFSDAIQIDPWLLQCEYKSFDVLDISNKEQCEYLSHEASLLFDRIQSHYNRYDIQDKPFLFLKADAGTYGMGVMPIESPQDLLSLNRKARNKLSKGKHSLPIQRFILQEGVASNTAVEQHVSEACVYQIEQEFLGAFYRSHGEKSNRECLNSKGMTFQKICSNPSNPCGTSAEEINHNACGKVTSDHLFIYQSLAHLAALACREECHIYETQDQSCLILK
eukprot:COSAG01_NODE_398_length_17547_cov_206.793501_17_plen_427_part_00